MNRWNPEAIKALLEEYAQTESGDPRAKKRKRILAAAAELFIRHGYRKASVDEIARRASVAKGTVYLYFKTKADLLVAAIAEEKKRYIEKMVPLFDESVHPGERLRLYLRLALTLALEMPLMSRLISGDREILTALDELGPGFAERAHAVPLEMLGELIDDAAAPHRWTSEELADRARVIMGLFYCSGDFADERVRSGMDLDRFAGILADMLVDGVRPPGRVAGD